MDHDHHHQHDHDHRQDSRRRMLVALALTVGYMVAEVIGGLLSGSLALLADAGHMLSDAAALGLAVFAMWIAARPPTSQRTYGYHRTEILAALANGVTLVAIAVLICVEAYRRFRAPPVVQGKLLLGVAAGGLLMNLVVLAVLRRGSEHSVNLRGAWLHVLGDALGSIGAMVSGGLVWAFGWGWADPLASVIIAVLVVLSAWSLLKETLGVLMEHAPGHLDVEEVRKAMIELGEVDAVHDLHVWTITSGRVCLSAHVVTSAGGDRHEHVLCELDRLVRERYAIGHVTIQLERGPCPQDCAAA